MPDSKVFVDNYLPALLGQAWMLVSAEFHDTVETRGLSVLEWRVLSALAGSGPIGISLLAQKTVSKQPTITRVLQRLELQGYVTRFSNGGGDRRVTLVRLTETGLQVVQGLLTEAESHEKSVLESLGSGKSQLLKEVLQELIKRHTPICRVLGK
ncbi:MarR family transcriptional regulator [Xenorhabdus beddingii]|uniref:MarR family transcriptional regulator n=1 Tax=Xenorhabdus beddingii TaxID=40578 RepID=A0A1Y2SNI1_9GAMM|nr:MarR family winged helix-turn-helix transcriptional regulator [Xenorhabdus beddingii]OTA20239.1 MarR family transcriptional regulator [Xenorhabdus beddingii]